MSIILARGRRALTPKDEWRELAARARATCALYGNSDEQFDRGLIERYLWWEGLDEVVLPRVRIAA